MPLFEFECSGCHKAFEALVYTTEDKDNVVCPTCHSRKVDIQLSTFGISSNGAKSTPSPSSVGGGGGCCGGSCGCM